MAFLSEPTDPLSLCSDVSTAALLSGMQLAGVLTFNLTGSLKLLLGNFAGVKKALVRCFLPLSWEGVASIGRFLSCIVGREGKVEEEWRGLSRVRLAEGGASRELSSAAAPASAAANRFLLEGREGRMIARGKKAHYTHTQLPFLLEC